jgi:hypothetical protein
VGDAALKAVKTPWIVFATVAAVFFLVSLVSYLASPFRGVSQIFFFPNAKTKLLEGELRYLPAKQDREEQAMALVAELLLGPRDTRHLPLVTQETRVKGMLLREGVLYIDVSDDILFSDYVNFPLLEASVKKTVEYNLPFVDSVVMTIEGYVPANAEASKAAD